MRIFIGWSGTTGALIGNETVRFLQKLGDWVEPMPWTQFAKGVSVWEQLLGYLSKVDAAVLIATPQDETEQRGEPKTLPRDNIILEYGLFTGALSRERVLLLVVGEPDLPSDMLGVNQATLPLPFPKDRLNINIRKAVIDEIREFLTRIRCAQRADIELCRAISRSPKVNALMPDIFWNQCNTKNYPTYSDNDFLFAVRVATIHEEMQVGVGVNPPYIQSYVDFARIPAIHHECLATRLADAAIYWLIETNIRPSKFALLGRPDLPDRRNICNLNPAERGATRGLPILAKAVRHLGYPILFVDVEKDHAEIFGYIDSSDVIVIIHDVVLSGQRPVRAACALRERGATAHHIFSLVANPTDSIQALTQFLQENSLTLHYKTIVPTKDQEND